MVSPPRPAAARLKPAPPLILLITAAVIFIPLLFYALGLFRMMAAVLAYPWELDQGEGHNVWSAWLLSQGRGPYLSLNHYPFFNINYPPLHFVLMVPLVWAFGPSLLAGRLLAHLCLLGLAAAIGLIVWRYTRNRPATGLAVLLILANPYFYIFGVIASVNVSQVMFGAWGLYCLGLALDRVGPDGRVVPAEQVAFRPLVAGLVLLLAALYTKQQAVDAVAAGFGFLLWRRPRLAVVSGLIFGLAGLAIFVLIDLLTAHQFYINLIEVNINDFIRRQLLDQWLAYGLTHAPLLLLAAVYGLLTVLGRERVSLWLLYLAATAAGSVLVGKFGAAETYFYSSITAVAIAAGLLVDRLWRLFTYPDRPEARSGPDRLQSWAARHKKGLAAGLAGLLVLQNALFFHSPENPHPWRDFIRGHSGNYVLFGRFPPEAERQAGQRLADRIKAAPPPVLTEEASFAMVNGYEVVTNPSNILVYDLAKRWQGRELTGMVERRCFSLILLHGHFLPAPVQQAMAAQYRRVQTERLNGGDYVLWERLAPPADSAACPASRN